jgi:imidazole glycerol-phosphate synthase subunit HisH
MIAIVDYGLGNPVSVGNMIKKAGGNFVITKDFSTLSNVDHVILPGVGHFAKGMENLKANGMDQCLKDIAAEGRQILGICLGMQLLTAHSEEGDAEGLGLINLKTKKFQFEDSKLKIPNMGWQKVHFTRKHPYLINYELGEYTPRFYFVHSYYVENTDSDLVVGTARYGHSYASVISNKNVFGSQFHPEKSHKFGLQFFKNVLATAVLN